MGYKKTNITAGGPTNPIEVVSQQLTLLSAEFFFLVSTSFPCMVFVGTVLYVNPSLLLHINSSGAESTRMLSVCTERHDPQLDIGMCQEHRTKLARQFSIGP